MYDTKKAMSETCDDVICHGRRVTGYITNKGRERYTTAGTFRMPEITEHELRFASLEATTRVLAPFVTHLERVLHSSSSARPAATRPPSATLLTTRLTGTPASLRPTSTRIFFSLTSIHTIAIKLDEASKNTGKEALVSLRRVTR